MVVDLCILRTPHPTHIKFIPTGKLVFNYVGFELFEVFRNTSLAYTVTAL
jgi:hypothetical protein